MIRIGTQRIEALPQADDFNPNSIQKGIVDTMLNSTETYQYDDIHQLIFELKLRDALVKAARDLNRSGMAFKVFRESRANPDYWQRTSEGGFQIRLDVLPSDAIGDIFRHGYLYGTECSTGLIIVYYKALLDVFPIDLFNRYYGDIYLMDWQHLDRDLAIGEDSNPVDLLPGDGKYFMNPDVNPLRPEWQGENTFYLGDGRYYGHGMGIADETKIIRALNDQRKAGSQTSAYKMDLAYRQNYQYLERLYQSGAQPAPT